MLSGKQIAEARKRKGLTQEALAAELGVSRQTIAKWEQEISTPSVTNAHRLIDILGLQEWRINRLPKMKAMQELFVKRD